MAQTLTRKRGALKHKLTTFSKYINTIKEERDQGNEVETSIIVELELRINKLEPILHEFESIQTDIEATVTEENLSEQFEERELFEQSYFSLMACATEILNTNRIVADEAEVSSVNGSRKSDSNLKNIKLPTIELPKFSGSYDNWLEFKDKFESLIHNNDAINDVQRYHYLRASLEGPAAQVIQSLEFSASNYPIAWELIHNRFENKQLLVNNHLKELFSLPIIAIESAENIRQLIDNVYKHLRALTILKQPIDSWDTLIIFLINSKLEKTTASEWEKYRTKEDFPSLEEMTKFLRSRADLLETIEYRNREPSFQKTIKSKGQRNTTLITKNINCNFCKGQHLIYDCSEFLKLPIYSRIEKTKELKLCSNCLRTGHWVRQCRLGPCRTCHKRHNTLLHEKQEDSKNPPKAEESQMSFTTRCEPDNIQVILSTACVQIMDSTGKYHTARAILDSGSQSNFVSQALCNRLGIKAKEANMTIVGFNQIQSSITSKCHIQIQSVNKGYKKNMSCFIIPSITDDLPSHTININSWEIPKDIYLSDPHFMKPGPIDLLIGAGLFWTLMLREKYHLGKGKPVLQNTHLGWIVTGTIAHSKNNIMHCNFSANMDVQEQLKMFWETEEVSSRSAFTYEEKECENHFKVNTTRQSDGRFIVKMPLKESPERLGESKNNATKRFYSLERKFERNPQFKVPYSLFMKEYEDLGHMTKINQPELEHKTSYFLPHHGVQNLDSTTTKLRVVFDGSAPTSTGWSLNDIQAVGPTIQEDLFSIVVRFRQHKYVLSADITKMYRQVLINKSQRHLQRILWRNDRQDEVSIYELNTVTYGTASSAYLVIKCLHELAEEHKEKYPLISEIICRDFYVDDLLTGADTREELVKIYTEISNILHFGCFELRKWISNNKSIGFEKDSNTLNQQILNLGANEHTKTLGIRWCSVSDNLMYRIHNLKTSRATKRSILSDVAQIFDPLGLVSPCVIVAKIMLQQLWVLKLEWDDSIPPDLTNRWNNFRQGLSLLNNLTIPRHIFIDSKIMIELHGFCDASQDAYGACIYARSINANEEIQVRLICAKSKVAPLKTITIPKLELNGALLLANLMQRVRNSLTINANSYYWCDSQITLCWINTQPNILLPFVSNRVSRIQDLTTVEEWQYVPSGENPADFVSRGVYPDQLLKCDIWWNGPDWLSQSREHWPNEKIQVKENLPEVRKRSKVFSAIIHEDEFCFDKYSSYKKLKRITAFVLRFINNCRNTKSCLTGSLTIYELEMAEKSIIKIAQKHSFNREIQILTAEKQLDKGSKLLSLTPFLDNDGILRVGGRLKLSTFSEDKKHPFLLHAKHHISKLILSDEHIKLLHAGPFILKDKITRGIKTFKCYICLFVCLTTKAIHLEPVTSMSTEAFIATLRRFIARRGKPTHIYSDNGRNFVGAVSELKELGQFLINESDAISNAALNENISWHFIPPYSPNFGGLWEAGVKSTKFHLKRVMSNAMLTFEDFLSVLTQVEGILNSRPLSVLSSDPNDLQALTPAHFLIGRSIISVGGPDLRDIKRSRLGKFQHLQQLKQHFWTRWSKEYISELQQRTRWKTQQPNIKQDDIVLLKQDNLPPSQWQLGRVIDLHPGVDNVTRVVSVKTSSGIVKRAVNKMCVLPLK